MTLSEAVGFFGEHFKGILKLFLKLCFSFFKSYILERVDVGRGFWYNFFFKSKSVQVRVFASKNWKDVGLIQMLFTHVSSTFKNACFWNSINKWTVCSKKAQSKEAAHSIHVDCYKVFDFLCPTISYKFKNHVKIKKCIHLNRCFLLWGVMPAIKC